MASRMDRYYKSELVTDKRSSKNKNLYDEIRDLDNYSNIEGVASIDNSNEIDISKVREMLKNKDNYNKRKRLETLMKERQKEEVTDTFDDTRSYDINSVLSKVRENSSNEKYRSLNNSQYEALKNQKSKQRDFDYQTEEDELKELIKTLHATKALTKLDDDVGLLDELKSDTMVGDAASIRSIIEEEKNTPVEEHDEIDKSFYTKSFGLTSNDFEELKSMNHKIKKSNGFIITLLIVLILLVAGILGFIFLPKLLP